MKQLLFFTLLNSVIFAGFFNETAAKDKAQYIENQRLCKLFIKKAKDYKVNMRDDLLATATLASYEHRASIFCKKAIALKPDTLEANMTK